MRQDEASSKHKGDLSMTKIGQALTGAALIALLAAGCGPAPQDAAEESQDQTMADADMTTDESGDDLETAAGETASDAEPASETDSAELVPRELFFGNPTRAGVRVSPDGTRLSMVAPKDGVLNVWVGSAEDMDGAQAITDDTGRGILSQFWAYNATHVIYSQDQGGDENYRIYSIDLESGDAIDLTPFENVQARILEGSYDHPDEFLIGLNNRDPRWHDVYRINVVTGERTLVEENETFGGYLADDTLSLRLASESLDDGSIQVHKKDADGAWTPFFTVAKEDNLTWGWLTFTKDGADFYAIDSTDRDTAALVIVNYETGEQTVLAEDDRADITDVLFHPTENTPLAYAVNYTRTEWTVLDESVEPAFALMTERLTGDFEVVSQTEDNQHWIIGEDRASAPYTYYWLDREAGTLTRLFSTRPELEDAPLNETAADIIPSRDGLDLVSYITLPQGTDPDGDGRPDQPLPMVLDVHGGPWARDSYGYGAWRQWLSNRGYAVLEVNFRGSTGFGKGFTNAGDKEWAGAMHDDLIDAVAWAVDQGIAREDKVAIAGGSYGGYATLVGLTYTPETFACGVDIVGPSNLVTLLESIPPYWASVAETFAQRIGDLRTEEGRQLLIDRSPLHKADQITKPLLIGQGANDPRVKQAESDQIVQAMTDNGLPVTYVLFPDEGHGFARPENRLAFYAMMEGFLSQCLGGAAEPIGDALAGSSTQVPVGADFIPGLEDALDGFEPVVKQ